MSENTIGVKLRALRKSAGWSLEKAAEITHRPAVVIGSWERGDRQPTVPALDQLLAFYGYRIAVVPIASVIDGQRVRTSEEIASTLRAIAEQIEATEDET